MRTWKARLWLLAFTLTLLSGCATIRTNPITEEISAVRAIAQNASAGIRVGLGISTKAGEFLDSLPIAANAKTEYDCAIVKVTGTTAPRPNLLTVCGPDTPQGAGPLVKALETLKQVTTRPGLVQTLSVVKSHVEPLIVKLEKSESPALRAFGASLRFAFSLALSGGAQ